MPWACFCIVRAVPVQSQVADEAYKSNTQLRSTKEVKGCQRRAGKAASVVMAIRVASVSDTWMKSRQ